MPPITFFIEQFTSVPKAPEGDLLKGKNVVITGANTVESIIKSFQRDVIRGLSFDADQLSGLGLQLAHKYAKMSPKKIIMTARNMKAGAEALDQVLQATPGAPIDLWELDLAKYSSIKAFAARAEKELGTVDLLMNNAGVNLGPNPLDAVITEEGHELSFQTNAIAPVLMLFALLPCLQKSSSPSVIFTTSEVHAWTDGKGVAKAAQHQGGVIKGMDAVSPLVGFPRYMESKMLLQMSLRNLIQALPNVRMIAVNPGLCKTEFGRHFGRSWVNMQDISGMMTNMIIARQPEVGARNLVHAAVGDFESCEYFTCAEPAFSPSTFIPKATGLAVARQYWNELLAEVEKVFPGRTETLKKIYA